MKDGRHVFVFVAIGLAVAFIASSPLRQDRTEPSIGTPLTSAPLYASGSVVLDPAVEAAASEKAALFLIVRPAGGGAPVAVQKRDFPTFPLRFQLSTRDNMVGTVFYEGPIEVVARLDQDGVAGPVAADDLESVVPVDPERREDLTLQIAPART